MEIDASKKGNVLVLRVMEPRFSADTVGSFKEQVHQLIRDGNRKLLLDLTQVNFIDSTALGAVVSCLKAVRPDGDLAVYGAKDTVATVFKLTRMDKIFGLYGSRQEGVTALS
jgi:anti-sigma B factor antagonist